MKATGFWYKDNWNGSTKSFKTLRGAKSSAQKEDGNSITIFRNDGSIAEIVKSNGYTYP